MRTATTLLLSLGLAACASTPAPARERPAVAEAFALPFVENDYAQALALARERGVPLFVDAWAPWCHTCLSMNAYVFADPQLAPLADRFVWLSIDTEREENADFLARHPMQVWPTLFVIDPREEHAVLRWAGSATVPQLQALLEDGERAAHGGAEGADALLARADRLYAARDAKGAAEVLAETLEHAPQRWPRRSRAVESLLMAKAFGGADPQGCAETALSELPRLPRTASWANVAMLGLYCSLKVPASDAWRAQAVQPLEARVRDALAPPPIAIAPDDRSGLYDVLASARQAAGDEAGMRAVAREWLDFLEAEAAKATSPEARAVYDTHRMSAAQLLGEPERAVAALEQSSRDLPDDYNGPARLAVVLLSMGRLDEALVASDRALALVYGPRKVRVLNDRGDILLARGDEAAARAAFREAQALGESLPASQRPAREIERAKGKLGSGVRD